ncbi:MAG: ABC transporter permease [Planctomycetia bacterium]|nr:ABC transporter permease [Planctomycetia bacterium]
MSILLATWIFGATLGLVALGVFVSYRLFSFPDVTTDGSFTLGAAVAAALLVAGVHPAWATLAAVAAGGCAGAATGIVHALFGVPPLLSGILMTTALASVNLVTMGRSNIPLTQSPTLTAAAETRLGPVMRAAGFDTQHAGDAGVLVMVLAIVSAVVACLYLFFRTNLGTAMRAGGDTATMARALGRDTRALVIAGLAIANGLVALSGALIAQYQRFADVQMGLGMVVWGMASVFLGSALAGGTRLGGALVATVVGSVSFRLLVAAALRAGLHPDWLKLATAVVVLAALVAPGLLARRRPRG